MVSFLSGSKKAVFELLQAESELSLKQIHLKLNKKGIQITNQGTFKILTEMVKGSILVKEEKKYSINLNWVKDSKKYLDGVESSLENKIPSLEKLISMDYFVFSHNSIMEMANFLIGNFFNYPSKNKPIICMFKHIYSLIGLSEEQMETFPKGEEKDIFVLTQFDSVWEDFFQPLYEKIGWKVFRGKPICSDCDWVILGDFICRIYFDSKHKKQWVKLVEDFEKRGQVDLDEVFKMMHTQRMNHKLVVEKNPEVAEQMRKETLELIEKEL